MAVDKNQSEIVKGLRKIGAHVEHIYKEVGIGDILVCFRGQWFPLEIKSTEDYPIYFFRLTHDDKIKYILSLKKGLTKAERDFYERCKKYGSPHNIVYDINSALRVIGAHKKIDLFNPNRKELTND